jgi:hypothetical protein
MPTMKLEFSEQAKLTLEQLKADGSKKGVFKQVRKALGFMETNLKHPSLNTHEFDEIKSPLGKVFESYAQNNTPGAYRIFWVYGPGKGQIYVILSYNSI